MVNVQSLPNLNLPSDTVDLQATKENQIAAKSLFQNFLQFNNICSLASLASLVSLFVPGFLSLTIKYSFSSATSVPAGASILCRTRKASLDISREASNLTGPGGLQGTPGISRELQVAPGKAQISIYIIGSQDPRIRSQAQRIIRP